MSKHNEHEDDGCGVAEQRWRGKHVMMMVVVVVEWQDGAGGSSNDSGGLSDLKVNRTAVGISRTAARV